MSILWIEILGLNLSVPKPKGTVGWKDVNMQKPLFPSPPVTNLCLPGCPAVERCYP